MPDQANLFLLCEMTKLQHFCEQLQAAIGNWICPRWLWIQLSGNPTQGRSKQHDVLMDSHWPQTTTGWLIMMLLRECYGIERRWWLSLMYTYCTRTAESAVWWELRYKQPTQDDILKRVKILEVLGVGWDHYDMFLPLYHLVQAPICEIWMDWAKGSTNTL